jgi:23S rRNA pseudouridine1911/1915/1917 synthase
VEKIYWAIVEGTPAPPSGLCVDWIRKDERHRRMHMAARESEAAREARLTYRLLQTLTQTSLVEIRLETGRKHQIRVQLSARGYPIVGDRKYASCRTFRPGIALHARRLGLWHPVRQVPLEIEAPLPDSWKRFGCCLDL